MARKKKVYLEAKKDVSLTLYTSLMLILLTFFIVVASMCVQDSRKQRLAINSLVAGFGILDGGQSPFRPAEDKNVLPKAPPVRERKVDIREIRNALSESGVTEGLAVSADRLNITITLKSSVLFKPGTNDFSMQSVKVLDIVARILSRVDNRIIITGHTDSVPLESPPYYSNWGLSAVRALAVLNHLTLKGVPPEQLAAYGMGAQRPITSNFDEYGRSLNRRVEITLLGSVKNRAEIKDMDNSSHSPARSIFYKGHRFSLEEQ